MLVCRVDDPNAGLVSMSVVVACQDCGEQFMSVIYTTRLGVPAWEPTPLCRACICTRAILADMDKYLERCDAVTPEL